MSLAARGGAAFALGLGQALRALGWAALIGALAVALAAPPLPLAVAALAALAFGALTLGRPFWTLVAIVFAIPFSDRAPGLDLGEFVLSTADALVLLLLVAWLVRAALTRELHVAGGALAIAPLGVLGVALLATPHAESLGLAVKEVFKWAELTVATAFVATFVRAARERQRLVVALLLAGAAEALVGVWQFLTGDGPPWFAIGPFMRAHGDFGQPNPFAGYLGLLLPLAVLLAASPGPRWRRRLAGGVAALLVAAMLMSLSRGAWLGAAGALAVVALHWSRRSRALLVPAALAVLTLIVLALLELLPRDVIERFATTLQYFGVFDARTVAVTPENFSVVERMAHWQAGWYMFLDHPLLGVGPGNYPARYDEYHLPGWLDPLGHAHNYYLNVAAELGVIGLATFLALLVAAFAAASRALRRAPEPGFERAVALGVLGGLLVFVLHNLFDSLFVHGVGIQVGIYLGLLGDARAAATGRPGSERMAAALARR